MKLAEFFESFRPLHGDLISQCPYKRLEVKIEIMFPSPSRGSYFSIVVDYFVLKETQTRFRPLHGDLISQLI